MPISNTLRWLLAVVVIIAAVFGWSIIDSPSDTGSRLKAKVSLCKEGYLSVQRCVVQLENGQQATVILPVAENGESIVVAVFHHPISGQNYYELAPASTH